MSGYFGEGILEGTDMDLISRHPTLRTVELSADTTASIGLINSLPEGIVKLSLNIYKEGIIENLKFSRYFALRHLSLFLDESSYCTDDVLGKIAIELSKLRQPLTLSISLSLSLEDTADSEDETIDNEASDSDGVDESEDQLNPDFETIIKRIESHFSGLTHIKCEFEEVEQDW